MNSATRFNRYSSLKFNNFYNKFNFNPSFRNIFPTPNWANNTLNNNSNIVSSNGEVIDNVYENKNSQESKNFISNIIPFKFEKGTIDNNFNLFGFNIAIDDIILVGLLIFLLNEKSTDIFLFILIILILLDINIYSILDNDLIKSLI